MCGDGACKEVIKVEGGCKCGRKSAWISDLIRRRRDTRVHAQRKGHAGTEKGKASGETQPADSRQKAGTARHPGQVMVTNRDVDTQRSVVRPKRRAVLKPAAARADPEDTAFK